MEKYEIGNLVVLASGSMRMAVESVEEDRISCIWCHEGRIGRDTFDARLLKRWEVREDDNRPARSDGPRPYRGDSGPRPFRGGDRDSKPGGFRGGDRDNKPGGFRDDKPGGPRDDKPRGKPGWDGKPREKKFFRKED